MNWKIFIPFFVSSSFIFFPQNIIGCGPQYDPYDFYVSFFHQNLPEAKGYQPFYYIPSVFLYNETEPVEVADLLAVEWANYCGHSVTSSDAKVFITKFNWKNIDQLKSGISKNGPSNIPDSVLKNSMSKYFIKSNNRDALNYIVYAKQVEPFVTGDAYSWDPLVRDSLQMSNFIKKGQQLYLTTSDDFLKLKYAYQITRLALYSKNYKEATKTYDDLVAPNPTNSVLKTLSLSLKAGAINGLGDKKQAAYLYSRAFSESIAKRISNYISFKWVADAKVERNDYLNICKSNKEKAGMLALFALGSSENELAAIKKICELDAANNQLEVVVVREINKLEQKYLTPTLQKTKVRSKSIFYQYDAPADSSINSAVKEMVELSSFLGTISNDKKHKYAGLFKTSAGYIAYLIKDFSAAKKYLAAAENLELSQKVKDQLMLTNLLITIGEQEKIDSNFEAKILPGIVWLGEKVIKERSVKSSDMVAQWSTSYRNLMIEILAPRYHKQGDLVKETLVFGAADWASNITIYEYYAPENAISFMYNNLNSKEVRSLNSLMLNKHLTKFEKYITTKNSITKNTVLNFIGTAYLREYDFKNALIWLDKSASPDVNSLAIETNPFVDLLYDKEGKLPNEKNYATTKILFAREMQKQLVLATTDKVNAAKHFYKIATGMYNMTYYGHSWQLVQYFRSSSEGYFIPADATEFEKEYYGCFTALSYFKKAMDAATDKNFKARCLFMMAKCSQKQVQCPQYFMFGNNWDTYKEAAEGYAPRFTNNKYFPQFIRDYKNTNFYKEAYSSCSYLRDFVENK